MSLSLEDFRGIYEHLRMRIREMGREDLDRIAMLNIQEISNSRQLVLHYLEVLISALRGESQSTYRNVIGSLREYIEIEETGEIEDIEVILTGIESELYYTDSVCLSNFSDHTELIRKLQSLLEDLESEPLED